MRRGLLAWNEAEVPAATLDDRVGRTRTAMADQGLDVLLVYTSFPRPAAVSWLTHFVPYWSQGVLLVPRDGAPEFFVSLSKRVAGWIGETSHMGEIVSTPRLGADLAKRLDGAKRIGVVEFDRLPGGVARPLVDGLPDAALTDATALFRSVRHPADAAEIAISRKAAALARTALAGALEKGGYDGTGPLTAAIEGPARLAGAEEVIVELAPDLAADTALRRLDGDFALGGRYAVRVSVAYKGHWVRVGCTPGDDAARIADWLAAYVGSLAPGFAADGIEVCGLIAECCIGSAPLTEVSALPDGAVGTLGLSLAVADDVHLASMPVLTQGSEISVLD